MTLHITQIVNSYVGKVGNIGARTVHIIKGLLSKNYGCSCICRGAAVEIPKANIYKMGVFGQIPRILNGFRIYVMPSFNHRTADLAIFEWFAKRAVRNELERKNPTMIHIWDTLPNLINKYKSIGYPIVLDVPIAPETYMKRLYDSKATKFSKYNSRTIDIELESFELADLLIVPSAFVKRELLLAGVEPEKIRVVEFGVNVPELYSDREISTSSVKFCFVGNINLRKGIQDLLAVWKSPEFYNDELHLCGRVFPEARELICNCMAGKIFCPGFVNTFDYLANCDVFVFPSWLEGSAKAVYEAMACGLPVIVTESAGSIVRDGVDGFVITAGDIIGLKEKMLWVKDNPILAKQMGLNARDRAKIFSWDRYSNEVIECYKSISD